MWQKYSERASEREKERERREKEEAKEMMSRLSRFSAFKNLVSLTRFFFGNRKREKVSKSEGKKYQSIKRGAVEVYGQEVRDSNPKSSSR